MHNLSSLESQDNLSFRTCIQKAPNKCKPSFVITWYKREMWITSLWKDIVANLDLVLKLEDR